MKSVTRCLLLLSLAVGGISLGAAQEKTEGTQPPPKVLFLFREFVKPGRSGSPHEKSESVYVQALSRAKWPTHYLAVNSVSGKSRSLFLTGYDSFEAWEKDSRAMEKNKALSAELDKAVLADGDLLSETDAAALVFRPDQSLHPDVDIPHMRYFEISLFHLRPGHRKQWDELAKMYIAGYEKIPDAHWATYQAAYGSADGTYAVFVPLKSASDIDHEFAQGEQFESALGEDGMKKLSELEAAAIESSQTNLFEFNPRMSYAPEEWIKADPDFWKLKSTAGPAAKKPAGNTEPSH